MKLNQTQIARCKHNHEEHSATRPLRCLQCKCMNFASDFACISCDQLWEDHIVLYETDKERIDAGKPIGILLNADNLWD